MIFHTFLVYLQILLQNYGTNQCIVMHWLKHKWPRRVLDVTLAWRGVGVTVAWIYVGWDSSLERCWM